MYHGIVKKERLDTILTKTGCYFDGLTPDIYIAGALTYVCDKIVELNQSLTISGVCPKSGSADSDTGRHTGNLEDAPHFKGHECYKWFKEVPYVYSIETIWAETFLHVLHNFGDEKKIPSINICLLDGICYYKYPQLRNQILKHAKLYKISKFKMLFEYSRYFSLHKLYKLKSRLLRTLRISNGVVLKFNIPDITEAYKEISKL